MTVLPTRSTKWNGSRTRAGGSGTWLLIGGSLAGFAGALLALPLAAAAKVVVRDVWLKPRREAAAGRS